MPSLSQVFQKFVFCLAASAMSFFFWAAVGCIIGFRFGWPYESFLLCLMPLSASLLLTFAVVLFGFNLRPTEEPPRIAIATLFGLFAWSIPLIVEGWVRPEALALSVPRGDTLWRNLLLHMACWTANVALVIILRRKRKS